MVGRATRRLFPLGAGAGGTHSGPRGRQEGLRGCRPPRPRPRSLPPRPARRPRPMPAARRRAGLTGVCRGGAAKAGVCFGLTREPNKGWMLRRASQLQASPAGESSWVLRGQQETAADGTTAAFAAFRQSRAKLAEGDLDAGGRLADPLSAGQGGSGFEYLAALSLNFDRPSGPTKAHLPAPPPAAPRVPARPAHSRALAHGAGADGAVRAEAAAGHGGGLGGVRDRSRLGRRRAPRVPPAPCLGLERAQRWRPARCFYLDSSSLPTGC